MLLRVPVRAQARAVRRLLAAEEKRLDTEELREFARVERLEAGLRSELDEEEAEETETEKTTLGESLAHIRAYVRVILTHANVRSQSKSSAIARLNSANLKGTYAPKGEFCLCFVKRCLRDLTELDKLAAKQSHISRTTGWNWDCKPDSRNFGKHGLSWVLRGKVPKKRVSRKYMMRKERRRMKSSCSRHFPGPFNRKGRPKQPDRERHTPRFRSTKRRGQGEILCHNLRRSTQKL